MIGLIVSSLPLFAGLTRSQISNQIFQSTSYTMASGHSSGKDAGATRAEHTRVSQVRSRVIFEREMGHTARPIQYDRTSVLLLGWCPKLDDTGVAEEVRTKSCTAAGAPLTIE